MCKQGSCFGFVYSCIHTEQVTSSVRLYIRVGTSILDLGLDECNQYRASRPELYGVIEMTFKSVPSYDFLECKRKSYIISGSTGHSQFRNTSLHFNICHAKKEVSHDWPARAPKF